MEGEVHDERDPEQVWLLRLAAWHVDLSVDGRGGWEDELRGEQDERPVDRGHDCLNGEGEQEEDPRDGPEDRREERGEEGEGEVEEGRVETLMMMRRREGKVRSGWWSMRKPMTRTGRDVRGW